MALSINDLLGGGGLGGPEGGGSGTPVPTPTPTSTGSVALPPAGTTGTTTGTSSTPTNNVVNIYVNGSNSPADVNMVAGQTVVINTVASNISGTGVANAPIVYSSSDTSVVTVAAFDFTGRQAQLNAVGPGSAFITVTTTNPDGSGVLVRFRVNVAGAQATEVSRKVVPATKAMLLGETFQFSIEVTYSDGSKNTITHAQWSSGAGSITTEGVLTATNAGTWTVDSTGATGASITVANATSTPGIIAMQPSQLNVNYVLDSFTAPPSQTVTLTNTSIEKRATINFSTPDASIIVTPNMMVLNPGEVNKITVSFSADVLNKLAEGSIDELITMNLYLEVANTTPPAPTPPQIPVNGGTQIPSPTQGTGGGTSGGGGTAGGAGAFINGQGGLGG